MKKAQGMSLNVIIVAVIALIVLIVLILIFTGKVKLFGGTATETASQYTGQKCEIPGTNNECMDEIPCKQRGGSFVDAPADGFQDCGLGGCCYL